MDNKQRKHEVQGHNRPSEVERVSHQLATATVIAIAAPVAAESHLEGRGSDIECYRDGTCADHRKKNYDRPGG